MFSQDKELVEAYEAYQAAVPKEQQSSLGFISMDISRSMSLQPARYHTTEREVLINLLKALTSLWGKSMADHISLANETPTPGTFKQLELEFTYLSEELDERL